MHWRGTSNITCICQKNSHASNTEFLVLNCHYTLPMFKSLTLNEPNEQPNEDPRLWSLAFTPLNKHRLGMGLDCCNHCHLAGWGAWRTELHMRLVSTWCSFMLGPGWVTAAPPKIISLSSLTSLAGGCWYLYPQPSSASM